MSHYLLISFFLPFLLQVEASSFPTNSNKKFCRLKNCDVVEDLRDEQAALMKPILPFPSVCSQNRLKQSQFCLNNAGPFKRVGDQQLEKLFKKYEQEIHIGDQRGCQNEWEPICCEVVQIGLSKLRQKVTFKNICQAQQDTRLLSFCEKGICNQDNEFLKLSVVNQNNLNHEDSKEKYEIDNMVESCTDNPPDAFITCESRRAAGQCGDGWMQGYCDQTCGRCAGDVYWQRKLQQDSEAMCSDEVMHLEPCCEEYIVQSDQDLQFIANRFEIAVQILKEINNLSETYVAREGDILQIC
eukprot:TRINITY_DN10861_c0_g1_i1.p1 TRINITY_DN10861_c0_g1~~TRINITY_DN10861_c0_g1_i1.p1  ORF type:complete len:298 (-),score=18.12 TRINITY_DN10861_c0_g1_i1:106-999(-)